MSTIQAPEVFTLADLALDAEAEIDRTVEAIRDQVLGQLRRKGVVLGISGGIDSSVTAALCVRALGPSRVLGLLMPERDSSGESLCLGQLLARQLGIETIEENISRALDGTGCYARREQALGRLFAEFDPSWKWKIALPSLFGKRPTESFPSSCRTTWVRYAGKGCRWTCTRKWWPRPISSNGFAR